MPIPFSAEPKLLNEIFGRDMTYIIPDYQRAYSWQCIGKSDKNNQVNVMWDDLYNHFLKRETHFPDYFFGSIVLIDKTNQTYEVIDGQQRLTTTLLLFASIKAFLKEKKPTISDPGILKFIDAVIDFVNDIIYNKKMVGAVTTEKKLKIEKNLEYDYDNILNYIVDDVNSLPADLINNATNEQKLVINRYVQNHDYFKTRISENFTTNSEFLLADASKLNLFLDFLKQNVSVVRILAGDFNIAYHVFEILNNRGLPLSNKDLLRNFIIKEFDLLKKSNATAYAHIIPGKMWGDLETDFDVTDEFIGRWVESYSAGQPKSSSFNDLKEIYNQNFADNLQYKKIEIFYKLIKQDLGYYTNIINNNFTHPKIKASVNFILNAPNIRYGLNYLLALSKRLTGLETNPDETILFLKQYEIFMFDALLVNRFNYGVVYRSIAHLNNDRKADAFAEFSYSYSIPNIKKFIDEKIYDNEIAKILIAKYIWITQSQTSDDVVNQDLLFKNSTLEHIIPQYPDESTNWVTDFTLDFRKKYTYMLGNMTLVTSKLNSSMKNFDFERKKIQYAKTKLSLTSELVHLPTITENYIAARHKKISDALLHDLDIDPN